MQLIYFLLGSNLGNREEYLSEAAAQLDNTVGGLLRTSSIYETASWGVENLPDYLNQVLEMESNFTPEIILQKALFIEQNLLRERTKKWYSRTIDIDILFIGESIINLPNLIIPHPEIKNRMFVLTPLAELIPDFVHPVLKKTIYQLRSEAGDNLMVKKYLTR